MPPTRASDVYQGQATNIAIVQNQVTTVVITAQLTNPPANFVNTVPVIDSLVVSSTNIAPGGTVTANVKAHDDQTSDTITFTWSSSAPAKAPAGSLTGQADTATTSQVTLTAPATEGDVTLTIQVQDNHGATTSASIVIHVSANANGTRPGRRQRQVQQLAGGHGRHCRARLDHPRRACLPHGNGQRCGWRHAQLPVEHRRHLHLGHLQQQHRRRPNLHPPGFRHRHLLRVRRRGQRRTRRNGQRHAVPPGGSAPTAVAPVIVDAAQSAPVVDASSPVLFSVEASDPQGSALNLRVVDSAPAGSVTLTASPTPPPPRK